MKERGIIFKAEMVRAILDGRKTQTRRIAKIERPSYTYIENGKLWVDAKEGPIEIQCPYRVAGDRLWVRETFALHDKLKPPIVYYRADDPTCYGSDGAWTPSIFMPRWASRITLEITHVRVERVQEISQADAKAEGMKSSATRSAKFAFIDLWDSIHGKGAFWERNDWVWMLEFRKL